jgi:cytosine/uracil/thiamine/allantoin permease
MTIIYIPLILGVDHADYRRSCGCHTGSGRRLDLEALYAAGGPYWYIGGFNMVAFAAWFSGFALYWLTVKLTALGGSLPSILFAGLIYAILVRRQVKGQSM